MSSILTKSLTQHYPGPFIVAPGNDWFDATFDIICLETEERLVSTYYWDAEEESEAAVIAKLVAYAMNTAAGHPPLMRQSDGRRTFERQFPGSYGIRRDRCPGRGRFVEVYCKATGDTVIQCYDLAAYVTPSGLAKHIAKALNAMRRLPPATGKS